MKEKKMWFIILAALTVCVTSLLFAAYLKQTDKVTNKFIPAKSVKPTVEETFDGTEKSDVYINVGKTRYPVYVRVKIVITWKDKDGIIYFKEPTENSDYTMTLNLTSTGWTYNAADGYYYYQTPVKSLGNTDVLIKRCVPISGREPSSDYTLSVEVIAQTIQAIGFTDGDGEDSTTEIPAYKDAWEKAPNLQESP